MTGGKRVKGKLKKRLQHCVCCCLGKGRYKAKRVGLGGVGYGGREEWGTEGGEGPGKNEKWAIH